MHAAAVLCIDNSIKRWRHSLPILSRLHSTAASELTSCLHTASLSKAADMDDHTDPYHLIKSEIDNELQRMTSMLAKLFAGHGEVAAELTQRLQAAAEQLQALETAVQSMVADPAKYGLTAGAAFGRKVSTIHAAAHKGLQSCSALLQPCAMHVLLFT